MQIVVILVLAAAIGGFTAGSVVTYNYFGYKQLKAANQSLRRTIVVFKEAAGFGDKLNEDDAKLELDYQEISNAILKKLPAPTPSDPVCLDADSLRDASRIK